ncbi:hypothetical protein WN944_004928 [Citrus x changshan-huyou]|uniref:Uncharacterized protein n=1 Tax=Citrus x changshan-huyou TaxID=2935761 RepID=A0AAP0M4W1_9ROSI
MGMGGVSNIFEQRDSGLLHFLAQGLNMLFFLVVLQLSHHSSFCPKIIKDFFFRQKSLLYMSVLTADWEF